MMQLSADLCGPLLELLAEQPGLVSAVEVGPWFNLQQIHAYRRELPDLPFHFHAADLAGEDGACERIAAYVEASSSPWASAHITLWAWEDVLRIQRGERLPPPEPEQAAQDFIRRTRQLAACLRVPLLLENNEPLEGGLFEVEPVRITRILEQTGCSLLLDTGHARIAAERLGMEAREYIEALPLDQVVQVHASGPRIVDGRLQDVHEPQQSEDYELLEFVLARTQPRVLTLEYIREKEALREQLGLMKSIIQGR